MEQVTEERITTAIWLDTNDQPLQLNHLEIDTKTDIVGDGPLFFDKPSGNDRIFFLPYMQSVLSGGWVVYFDVPRTGLKM